MLETDTAVASKTLLDVRDLKMHFPLTSGVILQRVVGYIRAVQKSPPEAQRDDARDVLVLEVTV